MAQKIPAEVVVDNRASKKARVAIGSDSLVTILYAYNVQFSKYSTGRKKVVQKIPATLWRSVYQYFINDIRLKAGASGEKFDE